MIPVWAIPIVTAAANAFSKAAARYIEKHWRWGEKKIVLEMDVREEHSGRQER